MESMMQRIRIMLRTVLAFTNLLIQKTRDILQTSSAHTISLYALIFLCLPEFVSSFVSGTLGGNDSLARYFPNQTVAVDAPFFKGIKSLGGIGYPLVILILTPMIVYFYTRFFREIDTTFAELRNRSVLIIQKGVPIAPTLSKNLTVENLPFWRPNIIVSVFLAFAWALLNYHQWSIDQLTMWSEPTPGKFVWHGVLAHLPARIIINFLIIHSILTACFLWKALHKFLILSLNDPALGKSISFNLLPYHSDSCAGIYPLGKLVLKVYRMLIVCGISLALVVEMHLQVIDVDAAVQYYNVSAIVLLYVVLSSFFIIPMYLLRKGMLIRKEQYHSKLDHIRKNPVNDNLIIYNDGLNKIRETYIHINSIPNWPVPHPFKFFAVRNFQPIIVFFITRLLGNPSFQEWLKPKYVDFKEFLGF